MKNEYKSDKYYEEASIYWKHLERNTIPLKRFHWNEDSTCPGKFNEIKKHFKQLKTLFTFVFKKGFCLVVALELMPTCWGAVVCQWEGYRAVRLPNGNELAPPEPCRANPPTPAKPACDYILCADYGGYWVKIPYTCPFLPGTTTPGIFQESTQTCGPAIP